MSLGLSIPFFSRALRMQALAPLHTERIEWYRPASPRIVPEGRLLLQTRRDGVREGYMDGAGIWRLKDHTVADVLAWADIPEGPL